MERAWATSLSKLARGVPAGTSDKGLPSSSQCSISWWNTSGRPVRQMISRNAVQIRLVHLWTTYQVLMVEAEAMDGEACAALGCVG